MKINLKYFVNAVMDDKNAIVDLELAQVVRVLSLFNFLKCMRKFAQKWKIEIINISKVKLAALKKSYFL